MPKLSKNIKNIIGLGIFFVFTSFVRGQGELSCSPTCWMWSTNKCCIGGGEGVCNNGSCNITKCTNTNFTWSEHQQKCIEPAQSVSAMPTLNTQPTRAQPDIYPECDMGFVGASRDRGCEPGKTPTKTTTITRPAGGFYKSKTCILKDCGGTKCQDEYTRIAVAEYQYGKSDADIDLLITRYNNCAVGNGSVDIGCLSPCDNNSVTDKLTCKKTCCQTQQMTYDEAQNICIGGNTATNGQTCDATNGYTYNTSKQQCCKSCDVCPNGHTLNPTSHMCIPPDDGGEVVPIDPCICVPPTSTTCPDGGTVVNGACLTNNYESMGIQCSSAQLTNGQCKLNIYKTLGIREGNENMEPMTFMQDIINGATMFIGTVVTIIIVYCGVMMVIGSYSGQNTDKYKKGVTSGLIGLVIVTSSYVIIRLVQFLAKGG